ncbi:hypothetical protein RRG08_066101 [Elysia crispata]|uniref:Uncharacterized protein n=1 Tax=Elysia crispata TaxID=231223 RepID=A0AAE0ZHJ3_9GAST|nr:hypothetical protein RRG08_066101 [Elysia crispata]
MPERTVVHASSHVPFKSRLSSRQENPVRDAGENSCSYLVSRPVQVSSHVPFKPRLTSRQENPVRDAGENSCSCLVSRPVQVSSHKSSRESSERCRREQLFMPRLTSRSSLVSQGVTGFQREMPERTVVQTSSPKT